jgi:vitamin B12 transporter
LLSISAGARLSDHSLFGNYTTFEITPSFRFSDKVLIYGAVTSGFNAPSLYQQFAPNIAFGSGITRGNDNLKPEQSLSTELGVKLTPTKKIFITLSGYRTRVSNAIEYVYLWNGAKPISNLGFADAFGDTYLNIGTNTVLGAELSFNAVLSKQFTISGNGTLLSGELDYSNSDIDKGKTKNNHVQLYSNGSFLDKDVSVKKLIRRPSTANLSLTYRPIATLRFIADYRYVGGRQDIFYDGKLGPYGALGRNGLANFSIFNLAANWQAHKQVLLQVQLNNIFDEAYMDIAGYATRRRGVVLSASFTF